MIFVESNSRTQMNLSKLPWLLKFTRLSYQKPVKTSKIFVIIQCLKRKVIEISSMHNITGYRFHCRCWQCLTNIALSRRTKFMLNEFIIIYNKHTPWKTVQGEGSCFRNGPRVWLVYSDITRPGAQVFMDQTSQRVAKSGTIGLWSLNVGSKSHFFHYNVWWTFFLVFCTPSPMTHWMTEIK